MTRTMDSVSAVVLFGGPGGTCTGLRDAGITDLVSVECDESAVSTARANGHRSVLADVTTLSPTDVVRSSLSGSRLLLQSSPPCQGLSGAGKGRGREDVEKLVNYIVGLPGIVAARRLIPGIMADLWATSSDERSPLTFETLRWIADLLPHYVALEQVPAALPIWEAYAEVLRRWGYSVWTGMVHAEEHGVPQTRKRAILLASLVDAVEAPKPSRSRYNTRSPEKLAPGLPKWISMAEALGWRDDSYVVSNYGSGGDASNRGIRLASQPSATVTSKIGRNKVIHGGGPLNLLPEDTVYVNSTGVNACRRTADNPAPTIHFGARLNKVERQDGREPEVIVAAGITGAGTPRSVDCPAPTVTGKGTAYWLDRADDYRGPAAMGDVRSANGAIREVDLPSPTLTASMDNGNFQWVDSEELSAAREQGTRPSGVRVTVQEAGVLQGFPANYEWRGSKTQQYQQVGNAVPPPLMASLARGLIREDV